MRRLLSIYFLFVGVACVGAMFKDFRFILFAIPHIALGVLLWNLADRKKKEKESDIPDQKWVLRDQPTVPPVLPVKESTEENTFKVAGVTKYKGNIESLGYYNEDFVKKDSALLKEYYPGDIICEYLFTKDYHVDLIPEPENPHDKNAIKVVINNVHVGYIAKTRTSTVRKLISGPYAAKAEIKGGRRKKVRDDIGSYDASEREAFISGDDINYYIRLHISSR